MKERPILMSTPKVRATLRDDPKTQTRRTLSRQFDHDAQPAEMCATTPEGWQTLGHSGMWWDDSEGNPERAIRCPYGVPGDRLWVRETFFAWGKWEQRYSAKKGREEWHFIDLTQESGNSYLYAAEGVRDTMAFIKRRSDPKPMYWKRPAIFMPRTASRISLEITNVRVERLQSISYEDALAEGVADFREFVSDECRGPDGTGETPDQLARRLRWPERLFQIVWDDINGAGSFDEDPWVWAIEFKRVVVANQQMVAA